MNISMLPCIVEKTVFLLNCQFNPILFIRKTMKNKLTFTIFLFFITTVLNTLMAKEIAVILIEVEIYKLEKSTKLDNLNSQLENAVLEESPKLITEVGKDATIEIGSKTIDGKNLDMIKLYIKSNIKDDNYDLDFQLISKGEQNVSRIEDIRFNNTLTVSASINQSVKIAKIKTTKYKNKKLALAVLQEIK